LRNTLERLRRPDSIDALQPGRDLNAMLRPYQAEGVRWLTDDAVAIRQFPVIERGIAVGLGLTPREAALRNTDPNGGVRNLLVALGTWSAAPSPTTRTIEVRRLHALSIDPYTGDASLDIALGLEHRPGRAAAIPFTGGTVRLDLIAALARARRSSQPLRRGAYHGPSSILIDDVELRT
jgi:hypothetical protein